LVENFINMSIKETPGSETMGINSRATQNHGVCGASKIFPASASNNFNSPLNPCGVR